MLSSEAGYIAAPVALETFLSRYQECVLLDAEEDEDSDPQDTTQEHDSARSEAAVARPAPAAPIAPPDPVAKKAPAAEPKPISAIGRAAVPVPPEGLAPQPKPAPGAPISKAAPSPEGSRDAQDSAKALPVGAAQESGPGKPQVVPASPLDERPLFALHTQDRSAEDNEAGGRAPRSAGMSRVQRWMLVAAVAVAVLEGAFIGYMQWFSPSALLAGRRGTLSIESRPNAVPVVIDGEARGTTPLSVELAPGPHVMELRAGASTRVIPITIEAGRRHAQYIELPSQGLTGALQIRGPAGLRVLVDGELRGTTPVTISDLAAGEHEILFDGPRGQTRQRVTIQSGATALLSPGSEATLLGSGFAAFEVPYDMQVFEDGRILGTTAAGRLPLTAGRHVLEIVSETLAFRTTRTVTIKAGEVSRVSVPLPTGRVTLTSDPVAEVWLEGQKIGDTPLENFPLPIGPHELVFRHPELGERREVLSVTAAAPTRVDVRLKR
jgi:hypothetical protein